MERTATTTPDDRTTAARIRDAAVERFAAEGFGVSIREIAGAVGVAHGLVRHHFGSKAGLRAAADAEVQRRLRPVFEVPVDEPLDRVLAHRRAGLERLVALGDPALDYLGRVLVDDSEAGRSMLALVTAGFEAHLAAMESAGVVRPSVDAPTRVALTMVLALGPWVLRRPLADATGVRLDTVEGLRRWMSEEAALLERGMGP